MSSNDVKVDEACPTEPTPSSTSSCTVDSKLDIDLPCIDKEGDAESQLSARSKTPATPKAEIGCGDVCLQTRKDVGCDPENPHSYANMKPPSDRKEPLDECIDKPTKQFPPRNPITGLGLGGDGVGGVKPRKQKTIRDGNPVTGEGYKAVNDIHNQTVPAVNGANQVINKNRIPPGGYSSGLW